MPVALSRRVDAWIVSYDETYVYLIDATGKKTQLWSKATKGFGTNKWLELTFDLKQWAGQKVQVQFLFDSKDSVSNSTLGVLVDDLKGLDHRFVHDGRPGSLANTRL